MSDKLREAKDLVREADTLLQGRITGNLQLGKTDYKRLVAILSRDLPAALSAPQADTGADQPLTPRHFLDDIMSACDPSNWDAERNKGEYFRGLNDAYEAIHEIASEYQVSIYAWCKATPPPSQAADRMREAILASIDMIENCADAPKNPDSLPEMVKVHLQQSLSRADDGKESEGGASCQRCQGNGEIVTDWETYLHPTDLKAEEASVAECPDCDGEGKRPSDPTPPDREAIARLFAEALDCAKECIPTACACRQYADRAILALRGGE